MYSSLRARLGPCSHVTLRDNVLFIFIYRRAFSTLFCWLLGTALSFIYNKRYDKALESKLRTGNVPHNKTAARNSIPPIYASDYFLSVRSNRAP